MLLNNEYYIFLKFVVHPQGEGDLPHRPSMDPPLIQFSFFYLLVLNSRLMELTETAVRL